VKNKILLILLALLPGIFSFAQDSLKLNHPDSATTKVRVDSLNRVAAPVSNMSRIDSVLKFHSPAKAARRSAIVPGLGQIYNKKYWKLPIIYGALGASAGVFVYNLSNYRELRFAYKAKVEAQPKSVNGQVVPGDSTDYYKISPLLINLDVNSLRSYRDEFRRNIDYSALVFILLWGLQVVDATVDAHLKSFDVSPDLSFRFKFGHSEMAGTNGLSFILALK
jgi:hypothetical protein